MTHRIHKSQHKWHRLTLYPYAESQYAECCVLFVVMLSVVMLSVVMLNFVMLNVVMQNVIMLGVVMLSVNVLNVVMLSVVFLNVVMLSVVAPKRHIYLDFLIRVRSEAKKSVASNINHFTSVIWSLEYINIDLSVMIF
jgi:hypothetical protein